MKDSGVKTPLKPKSEAVISNPPRSA